MLGLRRSANAGGKDEWCVASEDCAFGPIGFRRVRDVAPGEMIVIDPEGQLHSRQCVPGQVRVIHWPCSEVQELRGSCVWAARRDTFVELQAFTCLPLLGRARLPSSRSRGT